MDEDELVAYQNLRQLVTTSRFKFYNFGEDEAFMLNWTVFFLFL